MKTFGLIGFPLSHSFSKKYFTEKFENEGIADCKYELFPIAAINTFAQLLNENPTLCGLNVTIPYKVEVMDHLDEVDGVAAKIGAVNCISITHIDGSRRLIGYNTDGYGFLESLKPLLKANHAKALVFGNGGAAKAVKYALEVLGIAYLVVTRNRDAETITYADVDKALLDEHQILINTTPLGMSPNDGTAPEIPYEFISSGHLAYDLVYNPEETLFLTKSKLQGAEIKNGLEMLYLQAERSWQIWNGIY